MIVLALDTALEACSVAIVEGHRPLAVRCDPMVRGHQERLAPLVAEAVSEAGMSFAELDRIAVTVGPGSFTGLRVGLAFAKAMSLALGIPCVGVGTLYALAASVPGCEDEPLLLSVLDARRGHVYLQAFSYGGPLTNPANLSLAEALALGLGLGVQASTPMIGSGAHLLAQEAWPNGAGPGHSRTHVDPVALAQLALSEPAPAGRPAPLYLRAPDAKTIAERALAAPG